MNGPDGTTLRQFCEIVFAVLSMTGGVTLRNISRWTSKDGSYRAIQRFYNILIRWGSLCWVFFRTHLWDPKSVYLLAGDESIVPKSGKQTHDLSRFFASTYGKTLPVLAFFAVSLISVKERRSYPMLMEQVIHGEASQTPKNAAVSTPSETKGNQPGRPKGSKNRNKNAVILNDTLKQIQSMLKTVLATIAGFMPIRYFLLDGYFGNNQTLQMIRKFGLHLISNYHWKENGKDELEYVIRNLNKAILLQPYPKVHCLRAWTWLRLEEWEKAKLTTCAN